VVYCTTEHAREDVHSALAKIATSIETRGDDAVWMLRLGGVERGIDIAARWRDDLLLIDAPLDSPSASRETSDWSHLEAGGRFAGGVKLARVPGGHELRLRAELPLATRRRLTPPLRLLREGLLQARKYGRTGALPPQMLPAELDDPESTSAELDALCRDAGWTFEPRQAGSGVATLEVGTRFEQARLVRLADGSLLLAVELAACPGGTGPSASAPAHCLMRAAGFFRLVRPAAQRDESGRWQPRYEVRLAAGAPASELAEALSALSVACLYSAEELRILATDAGVAAAYLNHQACKDGAPAEGHPVLPVVHAAAPA
jgi:hypothetical protein